MPEDPAAPSRPPARDPSAPARLLALADELVQRTAEARRRLDELGMTVDALAGLAVARPADAQPKAAGRPPAAPLSPTARLVAVELALAGEPREQVASLLQRVFGVEPDRADAALEDLYR
jgi:hypothetical protein